MVTFVYILTAAYNAVRLFEIKFVVEDGILKAKTTDLRKNETYKNVYRLDD